MTDVPIVVREAESEDADRAVENIARKQLNALEEARAVRAMLQRGLSEEGTAQALGWAKARVTARVKILELPEAAQQLVGDGVIALGAIDNLLAVGRVAPELLDALVAYINENRWAADRLSREPAWVLGQAMREGQVKTFGAYLNQAGPQELEALRLGKKAAEQLAEAERLHRQVDRYAYGPPAIRFDEADVDQARAAGVLIEFEHGTPVICDRALFRELAKGAIVRTVEDLRERAAAATAKKTARKPNGPTDPLAEARGERDGRLRAVADNAHAANLDLGVALINGLTVVDPADLNVARFFVYALLGADHDDSPYTHTGERVRHLAVNGIRLVVGELRADVTKTRKDGSRGRLRIDYGDAREPREAIAWMWKFLEGAKTAGELYGRALVVIAAEQHASRLVLPASQRGHRSPWSSRKDTAAKALRKLAGPHVPASLTALQRAVKRAHMAYEEAEHAQSREARQNAAAVGIDASPPAAVTDAAGEDLDRPAA
jgi:hypothetical protein